MESEDLDVIIGLPSNFPVADVKAIGDWLDASQALVPGYIPPEVGLLDIGGLLYAKHVEDVEIVVLLDRNIASRMAHVSQRGFVDRSDVGALIAVNLMAFAQAMDIQFEPNIAFHELAHQQGNGVANQELAWFRLANRGGAANIWIDLALGRIQRVDSEVVDTISLHDLAYPLHRWKRNYIVALKIARLELEDRKPFERATALFDWMANEFLIAGPAAIFALMYFAPNSTKRRLLKRLRSSDREKALEGVANAAWDITHLSNFIECVQADIKNCKRYIFASADKSLLRIAALLLLSENLNGFDSRLNQALYEWWPNKEADILLEIVAKQRGLAELDTRKNLMASKRLPIRELIDEGEAFLRSWQS